MPGESLAPPNPTEVEVQSPDVSTIRSLGAAALDEKTNSLILLGNDVGFHGEPRESALSNYNQTAFFSEPNGDTTIYVSDQDRSLAPPTTFGPALSQEESRAFFNMSTSHRIANEITIAGEKHNIDKVGAAYTSIGLRFNQEGGSVTYPSDDHLKENLAVLRAKTGHAPPVKTLPNGTLTSLETIGTLADEGAIALAGTPELRIHDLILHLPFWAALPEETFEVIKQNARDLMDAYRSSDDSTIETARQEIADYNLSLEWVTEELFQVNNNAARYQALATLIYRQVDAKEMGFSSNSLNLLTPEQHQEVEHHSELLLKRTKQIKALYPADNQTLAA